MNGTLKRASIACMVMFALLMLNVNYIQGSQADKLRNDPLNARQFVAQWQHNRGPIMAGGVTLAQSQQINGDKKNYQRVYKQPRKYAPLTGYYSYIYGRSGIESSQNQILSGRGAWSMGV